MISDISIRESENKNCVHQEASHRPKNLKPHEKLVPWYTSGFQ